ncbi:hypothetical protein EVAR_17324_1 [Eumeta japonica]|uniref:Uncharacterized protein n=1 Tax=Eumeta variegata TaxID=151549 RepID=A0A4C1TT80_EUMVA|nr:hypothetical protein EVAR_17324_1 [Eumeta japonica]
MILFLLGYLHNDQMVTNAYSLSKIQSYINRSQLVKYPRNFRRRDFFPRFLRDTRAHSLPTVTGADHGRPGVHLYLRLCMGLAAVVVNWGDKWAN